MSLALLNLRAKFLLCDNALLDEQLCQRVGLGKAETKNP
jgi:hypothetical protein